MNIENLIYQSKLKKVQNRLDRILSYNTIYEDQCDSILLEQIKDLLDHPTEITLSIETPRKELGETSQNINDLQVEMIELSSVLDKILEELGSKLNNAILTITTATENTKKKIENENKRLSVIENDLIGTTDNISINNQTILTRESFSKYAGNYFIKVDFVFIMIKLNIIDTLIILF